MTDMPGNDGPRKDVPRVAPGSDHHWLTRPRTIRLAWIGFSLLLALLVALQWVIPIKGKFVVDGSFGFGAWFGFGACVAMVLASKVLGWLLKRPEDYYAGGPTDDAPAADHPADEEPGARDRD